MSQLKDLFNTLSKNLNFTNERKLCWLTARLEYEDLLPSDRVWIYGKIASIHKLISNPTPRQKVMGLTNRFPTEQDQERIDLLTHIQDIKSEIQESHVR